MSSPTGGHYHNHNQHNASNTSHNSSSTTNGTTSRNSTSNSNSKSNQYQPNASHNHNSSSERQPTEPEPNEEFTIRVLTLNCWGLWLGAKRRQQRMAGIVRYLRENNCDIVFLQEVWVSSDFEIIRNGTKDIYRFAHLFRSGSVLGSSGIVILCKWLPKVIHFEPYSLNGSPFYPWHGDWFAGKGIAYSRVDFDGLSLHLFSTHTHAYYKENEPVHDQYSVHRVCQSYQLARFITFIQDTACNRRTNGKDLLIVAGDMNSTSSELPYKILTTMAGLTDCFKTSRYTNPSSNIIHKHKIMNNKKKLCCATADESSASSGNSKLSFCRSKLGDHYLLDTLEGYRNKIAQLFDSDTDDEDITYCHPRNSFTPSNVEQKGSKYANQNNNNNSPTHQDLSSSSTDLKSGDEKMDSKLDRSSSNNSSMVGRPMSLLESLSIKRPKRSPSKRIDFILCSLLTHGHCVVDRIASESKDPTLDCSLSDHEPVMVELKICDISHDLMKKNNIDNYNSLDDDFNDSKQELPDHSRPLSSLVESKTSLNDAHQIQETTNQWVPEEVPINMSYQECNLQVLEATQDVLMQYYHYNRTYKTQLFYVVLLMFIITLPSATYYALANELVPISTIVFIWLASSFLFAIAVLIGFLSYRFEQGAIEATLNDITCKMAVAKDHQSGQKNYYNLR